MGGNKFSSVLWLGVVMVGGSSEGGGGVGCLAKKFTMDEKWAI